MAINKIKTGSIQDGTVTTDDIQDGAITNAKVNACAAIVQSKVSGLSTSISNLCSSISSVSSSIGQQANNIGLLGFKMAVNDGLTVFNLVDGVVDEFNDESGTDEAEGSNDVYCATSDFYQNITYSPGPFSAGFSLTSITEPDTSVTGTNPTQGVGTFGTFTVPSGTTAVSFKVWGAGGAGNTPMTDSNGGGGGFTSGTLAVTSEQTLSIFAGEGGRGTPGTATTVSNLGSSTCYPGSAGAGGFALISTCSTFSNFQAKGPAVPQSQPTDRTPSIVTIAGGGGGGGSGGSGGNGGASGGLTGLRGSSGTAQTAGASGYGGGGDQEQGGQGSPSPHGPGYDAGANGGYLFGANQGGSGNGGSGGGGFYGGASGADGPSSVNYAGGGGSSYYGHPQVTSGATEAGDGLEGGGVADPAYVACTNDGAAATIKGDGGYVLLTGTYCAATPGGSSTIVSNAFASGTVATTSRIVVFEENVDTPTLNTDIIASVSRDAGVTFTNVTLSDSGYVTGSSGQRILTGQADISGQPSGQSMRWKLALANNTVKIHGVSLQWS